MNKESVACCGVASLVNAFAMRNWRGMFLILLASFAFALSGRAATLKTDKPDYIPGEHVIFSGTGWQPGETVHVDIYETSVDPFFFEGSVSATARPNGTFTNSEFLVQQSFLGQGFMAHATGASSGATASTGFTDAGFPTIPLPKGVA